MKIAIETTSIQSIDKYRGIGSYTKNLISALKKYKPENKYLFFTRTDKLSKSVDLIHYPHFSPLFLTLPLFKKYKTVVTIHDLTPLVFPDKFPRGIKGELKWQLQKLSLKNTSAIITDSNNSKKDIVKFTNFPKEKIYIVSLAAGEEFKKLKIDNWKLKITQKYQLPDIFVLYVGDLNWNKNVLGLIKAFSTIQPFNHPTIKLVLIGKAFKNKELKEAQEINQLTKQLGIEDSILKLGFVPIEDLVAIYNLASVYCQPSFYEGFGLPVLEAMACGTPVVAAKIAVLEEVCGDAATYINPYSVDSIKNGVKKILCLNDSNHLDKIRRGKKQARKFSWKKTAKETIRIYEKIIKRS